MAEPFEHKLRVRYAECDPQGVVFNSHYLAYFDINITELWRAAFGGYRAMTDRGIDLVVAEAQLQFRASARFDDELTLQIAVTRMGNTAITSSHRISRGEELIVEGSERHVVVSLETMTKTPIPDWIREGLEPWTTAEAAGTPTPSAASPSASSSPSAPARPRTGS
jgi:acyl-CoA thioester hydrolase